MSTVNRVLKNTGFLYAKMGITVFINLFTTRIVLSSLGASDFGIFNIVGGAIGMLGFLNSTLANATQRFMSYAEGGGNLEDKKKIFNISISLHLIIAGVTALLLLAAMIPLFGGILNIDPSRMGAAKLIYYCLIVSTVLTIVNVPYDAVMNAHENMLYYSIIGIFESLLKLGVAFACVYSTGDKLIVYGILMACIPLVTLSIMKVYCHRKYEECTIRIGHYWDTAIVKEIATFSGWNFLTAITSLFSYEGINLVLNHFYGTAMNAAQGVAAQVKGQLSAFSVTMLKALNPVIVKNAGANDIASMNRTTLAGCKLSTVLVLFFAIPFTIEASYVLGIWLKEVPDWTQTFCVMQLMMVIINQMSSPAATAIYAQGDIKHYAIWKSITNLLPVIVTYFCFQMGGSPIWLYIPMLIIWSVGGNIVVVTFAKKYCELSVKSYLTDVCKPLLATTIIVSCISSIPAILFQESFLRLCLTLTISTVAMAVSIWYIVLSRDERNTLNQTLIKKLTNKIKPQRG